MNRDKPFRINQATKHDKKKCFITSLLEKQADCNKPKKGGKP